MICLRVLLDLQTELGAEACVRGQDLLFLVPPILFETRPDVGVLHAEDACSEERRAIAAIYSDRGRDASGFAAYRPPSPGLPYDSLSALGPG